MTINRKTMYWAFDEESETEEITKKEPPRINEVVEK